VATVQGSAPVAMATSTGGCAWLRAGNLAVGFALIAFHGTNACLAALDPVARPLLCYPGTSSGIAVIGEANDANRLMELRRLTGLTWEQLARVFNVSRRTLHFWAAGKAQKNVNEQKLQSILATMRQADLGDARHNRAALHALGSDGKRPLDLLAEGRYAEAAAELGIRQNVRLQPPRVSAEVSAARRPILPPVILADTRQETVHRDPGKVVSVRRIKPRQG
jgi:transcriptional regulator with XRE-family HTH domain